MQFIVETENGYRLINGCSGQGHSGIERINGERVVSSRGWNMDWYDR